jgi:Protein of unknown function (DUF3667)
MPPPTLPPAVAPGPPPDACLNCSEPLPRSRPGFCPACGQETTLRPPRLAEFIQQFGGAYFATEGALWRTLKLLLIQPGELTRQYLAGRRKHYVLPLRLYLTVSLVVLLAVRMLATVNIDGPDGVKLDPGAATNATLNIGVGSAGMKDGVFFCTDLSAWLCKRIQRRIDLQPAALAGAMQQLGERFVANLGAALFVVLPSFALWLKLLYWNRRLRYTEHLVFALHLHTFWFLMIALALTPWPWVSALAMGMVPVYAWLAMGRVYGGRRGPRLLRAALVSLLYVVTLSLAMLGVGLWAFLG